jgi:predicted ArsR family transcriptional regulator
MNDSITVENTESPPKVKGSRAVVDALKMDGPQTAQALSEQLGVTAMAVRQHLYDMADKGLVSYEEKKGRAGRPSKIWALTDGANSFFPDGHADLAVGLIHTVRAAFGDAGIDQLIAVRTGTQIKAYNRVLERSHGVKEKLAALARIRSDEGYMAEVEENDDASFIFIERHCPICSAAQVCTGLCASELSVFQQTLGSDVTVERTDHILAGARRCAYRIYPLAKA